MFRHTNSIKNNQSSWIANNPFKAGLIISIIFITVLLIVIEVVLRIITPLDNTTYNSKQRVIQLREHHPNSSEIVTPVIHVHNKEYFSDKRYTFRTDDDGFILPHNNYIAPDATIIFIGGSTTECMYMNEEARFPYLTEKIIETETNKKINVLNSGRAGNNSVHSLNILINKISYLKPNIVVLMNVINDYATLAYYHNYWLTNYPRSQIINIVDYYPGTKRQTTSQHLKGVFHNIFPSTYEFLHREKEITIRKFFKFNMNKDEWIDRRNYATTRDFDSMKKDYEWSLNMFIYTCKSQGIIPVLMTQANRFKTIPDQSVLNDMKLVIEAGLDYNSFKNEYDIFNETVRKVSSENDIVLIDLEKLIPQEDKYLYDQVHFTDEGSKLAASIISEYLINLMGDTKQ